MKDIILEVLGNAAKKHPERVSLVTFASAVKIAASIVAPLMIVQMLEAFKEGDQDSALVYLGISTSLLGLQQVIPSLQANLLIPLGTDISQELMMKSGDAFFRMEDELEDQSEGGFYEIAKIFGACGQPGAAAFSLCPVTVEKITGLAEIIALNVYMGVRLGKVASLSSVQAVAQFLWSGPLLTNYSDAFADYFKKFYEGFSRTLNYANHYVPHSLFNQKVPALRNIIQFMQEDLNPKTQDTLKANTTAMLMPTIMGAFILFSQLAWAIKQQFLNQNELILLIFYSLALQKASQHLMAKLIEAVSSWGLFMTVLTYIKKANTPYEETFEDAGDYSIKIDEVSYTYPKGEYPVIKNFSANIPAGSIVAITGENGNGKSTLFKLFFGFAKPAEGRIYFGGQDIAQMNPDSYRKLFAIVQQKPTIMPGTFVSNIACRHEMDDATIHALMKEVGLDRYEPEEIIQFDVEGPKISCGERQRISLARALLDIRQGRAKYLFWDEGLASLSSQGERVLLAKLHEAIREHQITTLMITHDLSRLQQVITFDQVIRMPRQINPANRYQFHQPVNVPTEPFYPPSAVPTSTG